MVLYHWARCSTCRKTREELLARGSRPKERDFFAEPLAPAELDRLAHEAGGLHAIASAASPSFRALGRPLKEWTEPELRQAILREPRLLRRPILERDDGSLLVGARAIAGGAGS
ncbi:MAG: arsenate reductase family protein [Candidatus Dormibacteraceae bacterium]